MITGKLAHVVSQQPFGGYDFVEALDEIGVRAQREVVNRASHYPEVGKLGKVVCKFEAMD